MKRLAGLLGVLLGWAVLSACASGDTLDDLSRTLSVDLSQGTVTEETDNHGGGHGDGERWVTVALEEELSPALDPAGWQALPLPEPLEAAVYGLTRAEGNRTISEGPYLQRAMPEVSRGYYFFRDRHSEAADPADPGALLERASFNFTIALYDTDSKRLYYCACDT